MDFLMSRVFPLIECIGRPSSSIARASDKPQLPGRLVWYLNYPQKRVDCNFSVVPTYKIRIIKVSYLFSPSDLSYIRRYILLRNFFNAIYLTIIEEKIIEVRKEKYHLV
jgi:hypothetical protein